MGQQLMITSKSLAKDFQTGSLGEYVLDGGFSNGKPTYKHVSNQHYIHWTQNPYSWMVIK